MNEATAIRLEQRGILCVVICALVLTSFAWLVSGVSYDKPALRFVGFIERDGRQLAIIELSNPTFQPIYYAGYEWDNPQQWHQRQIRKRWIDTGWDWCGTGMEIHKLEPQSSVQFELSGGPDENFHAGLVDDPLQKLAPPIRTGIRYGINPAVTGQRLWTDAIQFDIPLESFVEPPATSIDFTVEGFSE